MSMIYAEAVAHHRAGRTAEAEALLRQVVADDPRHAEARHRLGVLLHLKGDWAEAADVIATAIALGGATAGHHFNLALALHELDRYEDAAEACRAALRLKPDFAPALYTLGLALKDLGRLDEAIEAYRAAQREPDFAEAYYGEAYARLLGGDFAEGWKLYEARRRLFPQRVSYPQPHWTGQDIAGKTLLIHAEQGIGDTIQFARYVPLAAARGAKVILEVQPSLVRLLPGSIPFGAPRPPVDFHCPMMSLPLVLGGGIPATGPYLSAKPADLPAGRKIGIAWRGNPEHQDDRRRSMSAEMLAKAFQGLDVTLVCLQKDRTEAERAAFAGCRLIEPSLSDFAETASVIAGLDLVVSVDTAVAHLAGALNVPARVLLAYAPDWRWRLARADSDWYPSLRLIRQKRPGDWDPVIEDLKKEGEET